VSRLIIAIVVGIVIAVGAVAVVQNVLLSASNGSPSNSSLYEYGTR
jgi:NADH:ubiquinone oxidoreductase subunit 3 (subunit A)